MIRVWLVEYTCKTDIQERLGLTKNEDPEKIETDLDERTAKRSLDLIIILQIITFGRSICTARSPKCEQCFLAKILAKSLKCNLKYPLGMRI